MTYALITGASKGIGKALALELAATGKPLALVARSGEMLQQLAAEINLDHKIEVKTLALDLLSPKAPERVYEWCLESDIQVDLLINNAGLGVYGNFTDTSIEKQVAMMQINQEVLVRLIYAFIPMLRKHKNADILNVSSTAAFQCMPFFSAYAASKSFVLSFSRAIREELKPKHINVSCLCPGPTDSEFFEVAGYEGTGNDINYVKMTPKAVARAALNGLEYKYAVIIPGFSNKLGVIISKIMPAAFTAKAVKFLFRPKTSYEL